MSLSAGLAEFQSFAYLQSTHIAPAPTPGSWIHVTPEASRIRLTEYQHYSYSYNFLGSCSESCSDEVLGALSDPEAFCSVDDLSCLSECSTDLYFLEAYCACSTGTQSSTFSYDFYGSEEYCCGSDECQSAVLTFYVDAIGADATDLTSWLNSECSGVICHSPTLAPSTASTVTVNVALSLEASTALPSTAQESTLKAQIETATGYPQSAITSFAVTSEQIARRVLASEAEYGKTRLQLPMAELVHSEDVGTAVPVPSHLRSAQFRQADISSPAAHHGHSALATERHSALATGGLKPTSKTILSRNRGHSERKLATYEWVVSFDLTLDLADHPSLDTATDFATSVSDDLSTASFASALVAALPGVVSSVNAVTASVAHTRAPSLAPVLLPAALPTPAVADSKTAAQGSMLLLVVGCLAGALLLVAASLRMRHVLKMRSRKARDTACDTLADPGNGKEKQAQNPNSTETVSLRSNSNIKRAPATSAKPSPTSARLPGKHVMASTP